MLSVQTSVPSAAKDLTRGLLGKMNGNQGDDFTKPDETTIPLDSSLEAIHNQFGQLCKDNDM